MIANKLTILTATAALLEPALAINHRHVHHQHAKRGDWITATIDGQVVSWVNNYNGGAAPAATQPAASQPEAPAAAAPAPAAAQQTTVIKVAKPSQAAKPASKPAASEEKAAAAPKKAVFKEKAQTETKTKSSSKPKVSSSSGSSSSGGSVGFSHKRGLCYNDVDLANTFAKDCANCGWAYNWDSDSYGIEGLNFIPTLWSDDADHLSRFPANCEKSLAAGAKAIFSFNEPDNGGQAHMTPADAAKAHAKHLNDYKGKALISAPSVSNSGLAMEGIEWLENWVSECKNLDGGCVYDFCSVHWYSEVEYGETLFDHLEKAHKTCGGKPVWLTEFAPKGSDEAIAAWLKETIPRLEELSYLDAYSYWMVSEGILMENKSKLSSYGEVYASA
ncbi:hypothetical protein ACHAPJ_000738 [Fusarium lateritium]